MNVEKLDRIIIGLIFEFESPYKSVVDVLVYEADRKYMNNHRYRLTSITYTKIRGPQSKEIQDSIDKLQEEDILRETDEGIKIDYYSKAKEEYKKLDDDVKEILEIVYNKYKDYEEERYIVANTLEYPEVESTKKYGRVTLPKDNQTTI